MLILFFILLHSCANFTNNLQPEVHLSNFLKLDLRENPVCLEDQPVDSGYNRCFN
jgi:hypothetical protein